MSGDSKLGVECYESLVSRRTMVMQHEMEWKARLQHEHGLIEAILVMDLRRSLECILCSEDGRGLGV